LQTKQPTNNGKQTIRLLSYNIQVGIKTRNITDYIFASWQHLLPNQKRLENLHLISQLLKPYDIVALQEVDGGSLRSSYINQVEFLANYSGFPYWYHQCNRNLGKIAQHSNGILTKYPVQRITNHKLPGLIPGRGAIETRFGEGAEQLIVLMAHLALSKRARKQQIEFLAKIISNHPYVVLMGDLNCSSTELLQQFATHKVLLKDSTVNTQATFPSWQPTRKYDHIFVSPAIEIVSQTVLADPISDHLPISLEVLIPDSILDSINEDNSYHPTRIGDHQVPIENSNG